MADSAYRIFYGKYPDQTDNEIPNTQIKSVDGLQFRIEPGKPAEPKVDDVSFTLENLNPDGTERYDEAWFDAQSRSQAEGGTFPNQLFFSIELETGAKFAGVLKSKSYSKFRATVDIQCQSLLALVSDNNFSMLQSITISDCQFAGRADCGSADNDFPCALDLNGDEINQELLIITLEATVWQDSNPGYEQTEALDYFFPNDGRSNLQTDPFNCWINIGDQTILTTIKAVKRPRDLGLGYQANLLELYVYHAKNGNIDTDERTILERGRFFADNTGKDLQEGQKYTVTIIGPDRAGDDNILIKTSDMPSVQFMFGCPVAEQGGKLQILESSTGRDVFDLVETTTGALVSHLFDKYYNNSPDNIDLSNQNSRATDAFWGDLGMFGWVDQSTGDVLVNMATLTNSYVFMNGTGDIFYQDRLLHDDYLPGQLPPGAFEVDLADIRPLGSQDSGNGFDSFSITYKDRVEINNVESDAEKKVAVDAEGLRKKPALRNTDLQVEAYRTQNLGVPATDNGLPLFRRSPEDPDFNIIGKNLDDFIPTAPQQAQAFAKSWSYPTELWNIEWDMLKYPQAGIGAYFWVEWPGANRVYFIRDITHDGDQLTHRMQVQKVGVYNG